MLTYFVTTHSFIRLRERSCLYTALAGDHLISQTVHTMPLRGSLTLLRKNMRSASLLACCCLLLVCSVSLFGQQDGVPTFGVADVHEIDSINLATLAPSLNVRVLSKPGAIPIDYMMVSQQQCVVSGTSPYRLLKCGGGHFSGITPGLIGVSMVYGEKFQFLCNGVYQNAYDEWSIVLRDGTAHPLNPGVYLSAYCGHTTLTNQVTTDNSGYTVNVTNFSGSTPTFTVTGPNGHYTSTSISGTAWTEYDTFGNVVSKNNSTGVVTDSLATTFTDHDGGVSGDSYVQYNDTTGAQQQVTFGVGNVLTRSTNHPCADQEYGSTVYPTDSIAFPDGTSMSISMEQGSGGVGTTTGRIASFRLRTGGTISYSYPAPCTFLPSGPTSGTLTRTTPDGVTTYSAVVSNGITTTTVLDPGKNKTVYFISNRSYLVGKDVYQNTGTIASPAYTLLSSDTVCYQGNQTNCRSTVIGYPQAISQRDVYHTLGTMTTSSRVTYTYDNYGNETGITRYDFGASSFTTKTTRTYGNWNGSTCVGVGSNIVNLPCDVTTLDNASHTLSETHYSYGSRGFNTAIYNWTGSQWITVRSASANANGTPAYVTNSMGTTTYYGYAATGAGGCNLILPTATSTTIGTSTLTTSATWDCNGGKLLSSTDENGNATHRTYDVLFRPISVTDPLTFAINTSYTATATTSTWSIPNASSSTTTTVDSIGRPILTQTMDDGWGSYDTVSQSYGFNGTKWQTGVSEPCLAALGAGCPINHLKQVDLLGRMISSSTTGAETVSYVYTKNDVSSTLSPAPSGGEHTKTVQKEYDGLGRVKSTCSVQTSGGTACGQVDGNSGILTTYQYTYGPGSTTVTATRGAQVHTTKYDGLNRVTSVTTPESGTTTYIYDTATTTCGGGVAAGYLVEEVDNAGHHTCYGIDGLGRRFMAFVAGTSSPCRNWVYGDQYTGTPAVANAKLRIAEAWVGTDCNRSNLTVDEYFSYDKDGRITDVYETTPHSGGQYHTVAVYYLNGELQNIVGVPGKPAYQIGLDSNGRSYNALLGTTIVAVGVVRDAAGRTSNLYSGATGSDVDTYSYDSNTGRMTSYSFTVGTSNMTGNLTWNANGTLQKLAVTDGFNSGGTQTCTFSYDDVGRLGTDNCGSVWNQSYTYDQFDNINKSGTTNWNQTYNLSNNRINGASYDADGELTYDLNNSYGWDGYHEMISANTGSSLGGCGSSGVTCITYDALGRPVEKNVGGVYTELLYSPIGLTAVMSGQTTKNLRLPVPGGAILSSTSSGTSVYHRDWLGSARLESTLTHTQLRDVAYSPYGETYASFGSTGELNFTGDFQDLFSGLYDTPSREFDTTSGSRWLSPDPARASWNAYAYPTNPNGLVDPTGLIQMVPVERGMGSDGNSDVYEYVDGEPFPDDDQHVQISAQSTSLFADVANIVEVSGSAGIGTHCEIQVGTVELSAGYNIIGFEGTTGLAGGNANATVLTGVQGEAKVPGAGVEGRAGAEVSTKEGATIGASASGHAGPVSGEIKVDTNGVHTSAKAEGNKDIKLGAHTQIVVGVGVTLNLSQAGRAAEHARASTLALANYLYDKYIPSGWIF